jgi:hypothetical protein
VRTLARVSTAVSPVPKPEGPEKPGKPVKPPKKEKGKHRADAPVAGVSAGPTSRVTIALPFSQIRMQEPSQELADVVSLVGDLVAALKDTLSATQYEAFEAQVDSLRARLR